MKVGSLSCSTLRYTTTLMALSRDHLAHVLRICKVDSSTGSLELMQTVLTLQWWQLCRVLCHVLEVKVDVLQCSENWYGMRIWNMVSMKGKCTGIGVHRHKLCEIDVCFRATGWNSLELTNRYRILTVGNVSVEHTDKRSSVLSLQLVAHGLVAHGCVTLCCCLCNQLLSPLRLLYLFSSDVWTTQILNQDKILYALQANNSRLSLCVEVQVRASRGRQS